MPTIKNYGIAAVGNDVQLGKRGGRFIFDTANDTFKLTGSDGASVSRVKIADGTELDDAISLSQLNAVSDIATGAQSELDTTQAAAGLDTDGNYVQPSGSNYLDATTSLAGADAALDTQIKAVADDSVAVQGELDTTQAAAGLGTDGTYTANTGSNYLGAATTLVEADEALDSALNLVQVEVDATQVGAGLGTDGTYATSETSNYLKAADFTAAGTTASLFEADVLLDAQIKQVADDLAALGSGDINAIQNELDATQAGAGLDIDGNYVALTGSNYLAGANSIQNATSLLDAQVGTNATAIGDNATAIGTIANLTTTATDLVGAVNEHDSEIGDLSLLTTTVNGSLVGAINEIDAAVDGLGTISSQDADAVAITGGTIDGTTIGGTTAAAGTFTDVVVNGNLTVNGTTTTLDVENMAVSDNVIELNSGETGAGVTAGSGTSGIDVERGTEQNTQWVFDESTDSWTAKYSDGSPAKISGIFEGTNNSMVTREFGGFGVDTSAYADSSLVFATGAELAEGAVDQVLTTTAAGTVEYAYVGDLRDAAGTTIFEQGALNGVNGEKLEFASEADAVYLTATNGTGSGDVDLYLSGQGNGDVIISQNASQQGLIIAEDETTLTVSGGNSADLADAGDAILKGGDGSTTFASGDVILQGGTGGSTEGITIIKDSAGNEVTSFEGVASATDYTTITNGVGEATISGAGDSADVNLVLAPKGDGLVVVPAGYDITAAGDEAVANKGYVDSVVDAVASNVDPLIMRQEIATTGASSFNIGTMNDVAGKQYFVNRVTLHVTADITGVDHMVVTDGTTELAAEVDSDVVAGTYVVDLPFAVATAGGATIDLAFKDGGAAAATPSAGNVVAVVEYKVL